MSDENDEATHLNDELNLTEEDFLDDDVAKNDDEANKSKAAEEDLEKKAAASEEEETELDEDGNPIVKNDTTKDEKPEEYTKERFDGLMSTFNAKFTAQEKEIDRLTALTNSKSENKNEDEELDPQEKEESEIVKKNLAKDPVYQYMKAKHDEEKNIEAVVIESQGFFEKLAEEDKTQDFSDPKVREKYYNLAAELTTKLKTPVTVYAAHTYEMDVKSKQVEKEKEIEQDQKRKKEADLKPKTQGGNAKAKVDLNQDSGTFWEGVGNDLKS